MTKMALLCGVDEYPAPTDSLQAAAKEAKNWERILRAECGFDTVTCLTDENATRTEILRQLRTLFGNAKADDDVIVGFFGHGSRARGWSSDSTTNGDVEHAFIAYMGTDPLQSAAVTPSDIARILTEKKTPAGARVVLALDMCFAARFGDSRKYDAAPAVGPKVLYIENPDFRDGEARSFASIKAMVADVAIAEPLIFAASRTAEPAHEVGSTNDRRLAFSSALQNVVETSFAQELTYAEARDKINPISDVQYAVLLGNADLEDALFGGGYARQIGIRVPDAAPGSETQAAAGGHAVVAAAGSLKIRLLGLLTLVGRPASKLPYRNRLVAPFDNQAQTGQDRHDAFVEVADRDFLQPPFGLPTHEYIRAGVKYSRWQLSQHRVTFDDVADTGQPVMRSAAFDRHVPSLPVVTPTLDPLPVSEATDPDTPAANRFTAFFDLQCGSASVEPEDLEQHRTHFRTRRTQVRTWGPEYTPISARLEIPLAKNFAVITIVNAARTIESVIYVKSGATILIGNARELDINGPGSGEGPREHFLVYYQLAPQEPINAGLPETVQVPINACTVTTWP